MGEQAAKGTRFGIEIDASPGTFTDTAQVRNVSGPSLALDPLDVSAHDDDSRFYRDFIAGWHDPGEVTLELLFDNLEPTHEDAPEGLIGIYDAAEVHGFEISWPPNVLGTSWQFDGIVTGFEPGAPFDEALTATVTIKLTMVPTYN